MIPTKRSWARQPTGHIGSKKARNTKPTFIKLYNTNITDLSQRLNMNDEVFSGFTFIANWVNLKWGKKCKQSTP